MSQFIGRFEEIDEDTSGGILCSEGVKRDDAQWLIDGITWNDELPLNVEHSPPPVGVFTRIGRTTVNGLPALAGVWKWGPQSVPRVAEVRALVKAGVYTALSSGIIPLDREFQDGVLTITRADLLECSVVSTPADPLAKITQRSLDRFEMGRVFRSLPSVSKYAIERVMDRIVDSHRPSKPVGLMNEFERAAYYREEQRQRTMTAWAAGRASEADDQERRRARVAELVRTSHD